MPLADSKNFEDCVQKRMKESNYTREVATKVCGKMKAELEKGVQEEYESSQLSPEKKDTKEIQPVVKAWEFDPNDILKSKRKVTGTFHVPKVDKDREIITKAAMGEAIPDFMHLPILHDFHKERVLGVITKVWEESDAFHFNALFKATKDVDDAWAKVQKGEYDHVSIFGARLKGNASCGLEPHQRAVPCVSDKIRLDSISACDENARNDSTSMSMTKAQEFITNSDSIIKALDTNVNIVHGTYDGVGGKKGGKMRVREVDEKEEEEDEVEKGGFVEGRRHGETLPKQSMTGESYKHQTDKHYKPFKKGDEEDMEKAEMRIPLKEEKPKEPVKRTSIRDVSEKDEEHSSSMGMSKACDCDAKKDMLHKAKESLKGMYSMIKELITDDKKMVAKDEEAHKEMKKSEESEEEIDDESEEEAEKESPKGKRFKKGAMRPQYGKHPKEVEKAGEGEEEEKAFSTAGRTVESNSPKTQKEQATIRERQGRNKDGTKVQKGVDDEDGSDVEKSDSTHKRGRCI